MSTPDPVTITSLGNELFALIDSGQAPATVFLGAGASISSGVPSWVSIATQINAEAGFVPNPGESPIEALIRNLGRPSEPGKVSASRYSHLYRHLKGKNPSIGYHHLSQLISEGYINTIITTNWDCLLEEALSKYMPLERIRVFVRGIVPDDVIANALSHEVTDDVVIIKLHGDIRSRTFFITDNEVRKISRELEEQLSSRLRRGSYVIGTTGSDVDVLRLLLNSAEHCYMTISSPSNRGELQSLFGRAGVVELSGERKVVNRGAKRVNIGDFDNFFAQLNLAVQLKRTANQKDVLNKIKDGILSNEKSGLRYIKNSQIEDHIERFWLAIRKIAPNLIVFVNDPKAPGGLEVKRRLLAKLEDAKIAHEDIRVAGQMESRAFERRAGGASSTKVSDPRIILILDAITFSGNTLKIAKDEVKKWYPHAQIKTGVLVISQHLLSDLHSKPDSEQILYESSTDRFELFFPWGVTQTTGDFKRQFKGLSNQREILINKRAWGAVEILAEREFCSVRLLVIESGTKLSFQRHLCRDELYVALDDNISLSIAGHIENVEAIDEFNPAIHSLILEKGDYVYIPRGVWHRPQASMDRVRILELAFGVYDQTDDIERLFDHYGRERQDGSA